MDRSVFCARWPMASGQLEGTALVTGGGRGVGASIARELAAAGMRVAVTARSADEVLAVAQEIRGVSLVGDVSKQEDVERWTREAGPLDLLVANAGVVEYEAEAWRTNPADWWRIFEINVLGVYLSCRAVIPGMIAQRRGRIIIVGSGAAFTAGLTNSAYAPSKAAAGRFGEVLATQLAPHGIAVFVVSPGLVRTRLTEGHFPEVGLWTPPEEGARLARALATGRFDALSGRYLDARRDTPEDLEERTARIVAEDLNAVRLRQ